MTAAAAVATAVAAPGTWKSLKQKAATLDPLNDQTLAHSTSREQLCVLWMCDECLRESREILTFLEHSRGSDFFFFSAHSKKQQQQQQKHQ